MRPSSPGSSRAAMPQRRVRTASAYRRPMRGRGRSARAFFSTEIGSVLCAPWRRRRLAVVCIAARAHSGSAVNRSRHGFNATQRPPLHATYRSDTPLVALPPTRSLETVGDRLIDASGGRPHRVDSAQGGCLMKSLVVFLAIAVASSAAAATGVTQAPTLPPSALRAPGCH